MSTFEREYQRRLRVVLAEHCDTPIPATAVVEIERIEAIPESDESVSLYLTLRATVADRFVAVWEIEGADPHGILMAAVLAVPEEGSDGPTV